MFRRSSTNYSRNSQPRECDLTDDTHTLCSDLTLEICKNQKRNRRVRKNAISKRSRRRNKSFHDVSILTNKQKNKYIKQKTSKNWSKANRLKNRRERLERDNRSTVNMYKKAKKRKAAAKQPTRAKCNSMSQVIELNRSGSIDSNVTNSQESNLEKSETQSETLNKNKKKFMQSNITLWKLGLTWSSQLEDMRTKNDKLKKDLDQKNSQIEEIFDSVELKTRRWNPVPMKTVVTKSKLKYAVVCALCKRQIAKDDTAAVSTCEHCYHLGCAVVWFKKDNQCAVCSHDLFEKRKGKKRRKSKNLKVDDLKMIELVD